MLRGVIWIVCLFVKDLKELGTESLLQYGYVATLSVLLFVSCSGLGLAFFGLGPSEWCRRARALAARFAPCFQSSSLMCAAMLAAILSFDFRKREVVKEGLNKTSLKGVVALHQVQNQKDAAAAYPKLVKQSCSSEFTFFLEEQKGPFFRKRR